MQVWTRIKYVENDPFIHQNGRNCTTSKVCWSKVELNYFLLWVRETWKRISYLFKSDDETKKTEGGEGEVKAVQKKKKKKLADIIAAKEEARLVK